MQTQQFDRLRAPRRPRCAVWVDRAAEHPRAWWTVTAVCVAASLALVAVMAAGGLYPVTDWNGPRGLKPGHAAPTVAAGRAH